jgi:hypothetical protein
MHSRQSTIALLTLAGLACSSSAQVQVAYDPADPILREALRRVYPTPRNGGGGAQDAAVGPDVIVGEIEESGCCPQGTQISPSASSGGLVAYGLGTSSCNIATLAQGGQHLLWRSQTPFHPIIPQNLYRLKTVNGSTRLEQLGQSWSKYAFTALQDNVCNIGCSGVGGSILGMGCSDPYTASRNATQSSAGPRYQCNPFTGVFPDGTAVRAAWPAVVNSLSRRLQVSASDIDPAQNPGALYFGEAMYVNRDDACWGNSKNNASYRRLTIASPSNMITLQGTSNGVVTGTARTKPAINAWRDHGGGLNVVDSNVMITEVTCGNTFFSQPAYPYSGAQGAGTTLVLPAGDGWVYVASRATDLGGGVWHYEYAVENLNSDRGIGSFRINFPAGTVVTNAAMRQLLCHSGVAADDANRNAAWTQTVNSDHIIWGSPNTYSAATPELGSYIRWGTMCNFRFDANVAPATGGNAVLGYYKPLATYVDTINAAAHVPGSPPPPVCYADCDGVGGLTANDFACFLNAYSNGQSYANCDGVGGLTANDFSCFLNAYANGCS